VTTILLLYVSGGDFGVRHVERMVRQVRRFGGRHAPIVCFTDKAPEFRSIVDHTVQLSERQLSWGMAGFWPKLALTLFEGPALYLDLDVTLIRSIAPFQELALNGPELIMCRDFWGCDPPRANGSVIGWPGDASYLHDEFDADPVAAKTPADGFEERHWCDQTFMLTRARPAFWQTLLPGMLYSFKREVLSGGAGLADARIIVSHDRPRPWDPAGADAWLEAHSFDVEGL
jgi:hypothetical protein